MVKLVYSSYQKVVLVYRWIFTQIKVNDVGIVRWSLDGFTAYIYDAWTP